MGNLAMRNRSMFQHVTLYAVIFLCLSIAAAPLALLALFFFLTDTANSIDVLP
jgi:hypothetical protein